MYNVLAFCLTTNNADLFTTNGANLITGSNSLQGLYTMSQRASQPAPCQNHCHSRCPRSCRRASRLTGAWTLNRITFRLQHRLSGLCFVREEEEQLTSVGEDGSSLDVCCCFEPVYVVRAEADAVAIAVTTNTSYWD